MAPPTRPTIQPINSVPLASSVSAPTEESQPKKTKNPRNAKTEKKDVAWKAPHIRVEEKGLNIMTQLVGIVEFLKKYKNPIRLQDLAIYSDTALLSNPSLLERFKSHDRVVFDPKTTLCSYKRAFSFGTKEKLLAEIKRHHTLDTGGVSVKSLVEVSENAQELIEMLEKEGEILVLRTAKKNQMSRVFWNEVKSNAEGGISVEKEFQDLWKSLVVPDDTDLSKSLASQGIKETASEPVKPLKRPSAAPVKKGKKISIHNARKITNTHLQNQIDLNKDYVPSGSSKTKTG